MFRWLFRRDPWPAVADDLYRALVAQAREPIFFEAWSVPDTVPGRFDMICLHAFLLLRRLKQDRPRSEALSQALFDRMFADVDHNLREMGVGDMGVGKRVKDMAASFYGRVTAYEAGLRDSATALEDALARNVYAGQPTDQGQVASLGRYLRAQDAFLKGQNSADLMKGQVRFAPPQDAAAGPGPMPS